ncbi:uncharacterized protein LOC124161396 [Ischnura elegans]|uniref:uncharacterized protein LOC124161396 n=1 Tax=Ischnura elegans TaxID=197161 RepID=UPI001ED8A074|nr:uncharacterized protein LOC124161396 [Ischnura elegans]
MKYAWQEKVNEIRGGIDFDRGIIQEVNGWKGGILTPSGAGRRVIILHVGSESGFLQPEEETMLVFEGKKDSADYHSEMNALHFEEYFRRILRHLPEKSVLVIDQAPYHTMQDPQTKNPNLKWTKVEIIDWLVKNRIEPAVNEDGTQDNYESLTKSELIELGKWKFKTFRYLLDTVIQESGKRVKLLWTPVAHCEFNAIELIWAWVKNWVAKNNKTHKIKDVLQLCVQALGDVTVSTWKNAVEHVKKIEDYYWIKDRLVEEFTEPIIINLEDESSNSWSSSDED